MECSTRHGYFPKRNDDLGRGSRERSASAGKALPVSMPGYAQVCEADGCRAREYHRQAGSREGGLMGQLAENSLTSVEEFMRFPCGVTREACG